MNCYTATTPAKQCGYKFNTNAEMSNDDCGSCEGYVTVYVTSPSIEHCSEIFAAQVCFLEQRNIIYYLIILYLLFFIF